MVKTYEEAKNRAVALANETGNSVLVFKSTLPVQEETPYGVAFTLPAFAKRVGDRIYPSGYNVFVRTWWRENPEWPNGLEPHVGTRRYLARGVSYERALELCKEYNDSHDPGRLSKKAEFESA